MDMNLAAKRTLSERLGDLEERASKGPVHVRPYADGVWSAVVNATNRIILTAPDHHGAHHKANAQLAALGWKMRPAVELAEEAMHLANHHSTWDGAASVFAVAGSFLAEIEHILDEWEVP
jgi:hypothetical protein